MIISKKELASWDTFESVVDSFEKRGFKDYVIKHEFAVICIDRKTVLRVYMMNGSTSRFSRYLGGQVRYLLLLGKNECVFVKTELTESGANRYLKFKFSKSNPRNTTIAKLKSLKFGHVSTFDNLFDTKEIVKSFYDQYKKKLDGLTVAIKGIPNKVDCAHYAQIMFYRLMFLYFIQTKGFLSGNSKFLTEHFRKAVQDKQNFYSNFLIELFFGVLNTPVDDRSNTKYTDIPFLNGGLFRAHRIEIENRIHIENSILKEVLDFLSEWLWYVDETADEGGEMAINPEILGHIFEKTITDQKGKGAYYTPTDVTKFIIESTIVPYCLDRINKKFDAKHKSLDEIVEEEQAVSLYFDVIRGMTVLDNACGSGEFLLSASRLLFDLYSTTWDKIKGSKTDMVKNEKKLMTRFGTPEYYFKRRIVSSNLFGVDLEEEATEICKLRLWLSLVSKMTIQNAEPLPNIDYNIMVGNSLLGYTTAPQFIQNTIDGAPTFWEIIARIDRLKQKFRNESKPAKSDPIKEEIDIKLRKLDADLTKARNADYKFKSTSDKKLDSMNPFHYILHFNEVLRNGGFDIVVGNPPYVEKNKLTYPTWILKTHKAGNTYAYFFEVSTNLLQRDGRIGYIVPVSSISTDRMTPLQDLLAERCSELRISSYDDRPGKLFEGLEHCRSSIILGHMNDNDEDHECSIYTTGYKRWYAKDRPQLFLQIKYIRTKRTSGCIPKIGSYIGSKILERIQNDDIPTLERVIHKKNTPHTIWFHNSPQYWIRAMNTPDTVNNEDEGYKSDQIKPIYFASKKAAIIGHAILNSTLFYWFFIKTSDCRHLNLREIKMFRADQEDYTDKDIIELGKLVRKLMKDYYRFSVLKENKRRNGDTIRYREFYPKYSKKIIDKIDDALAKHYQLTPAELEYIKKFDEKFRIG